MVPLSVKWLVACALVATVLRATPAGAEPPARWQSGPTLALGRRDNTVLLADGRVLTCFGAQAGARCELVEPLTGAHRVAFEASRDWLLTGALSLDDGKVLLPEERALLNPETGVKEPLPPTDRQLGQLQGAALSSGRAAFRFGSEHGRHPDCFRLLLFLGAERGFVELEAAPPGSCVEAVHDLRDGRLLIARSTPSKTDRSETVLDFVLLKIADLSWQRGARLRQRAPIGAFRWGDGILALVRDAARYSKHDDRGEALLLDAAAGAPRRIALPKAGVALRAYRLAGSELVLFDERGALLWDPARVRLTPVPLPAPDTQDRQLVERDGELLLLDHGNGRAFLLSRKLPPRQTPCDDAFAFAEAVMARKNPLEFRAEQFDALFSRTERLACRDHLSRARRLSPSLQVPLDSLLARRSGPASQDEEVAGRLLCSLAPSWGEDALLKQVSERLDSFAREVCRHGREQLPALAAAGTPRAPKALADAGLREWSDGTHVQPWVVPLLHWHDELARVAGPLLHEARARRAVGFSTLRAELCEPLPRAGLIEACAASRQTDENDWQRASEVQNKLLGLGIAAAVIGGLGTLAYVDRDGDGGRAIAIGSGVVGGGALGLGLTLAAASGGGNSAGMLAMVLALPMAVAGGVAGGLVAAKTSEQPGAARFATAAVPLSALLLTGVTLTVANW